MKKLSKQQLTRYNEIIKRAEEIEETLQEAVNRYNVLCEDAKEFTEEVFESMDDFFNEKSEAWQESETGERYAEWRDEWNEIEFEEASIPDVTLSDMLQIDLRVTFDNE